MDETYLFESPRVGNAEFVELYNALFKSYRSRVWRVEHGYDVVPKVPMIS